MSYLISTLGVSHSVWSSHNLIFPKGTVACVSSPPWFFLHNQGYLTYHLFLCLLTYTTLPPTALRIFHVQESWSQVREEGEAELYSNTQYI